jgi:Protein of unknown function (DUF2846)
MIWRSLTLASAVVLLSGCAGSRTGADYAALVQKVGPPRPAQSRIVVLQEKASGLGLSSTICEVQLDGGVIGRLKPGTYVYADRPAGKHQLLATEAFFPGDTRYELKSESGRTYFFLARASARHDAVTGMSVMGGLAGALVSSVATAGSENAGPVDFVPLDEAAARTMMIELQLAE